MRTILVTCRDGVAFGMAKHLDEEVTAKLDEVYATEASTVPREWRAVQGLSLRDLAGAWPDFPPLEELREYKAEDVPREKLGRVDLPRSSPSTSRSR